MNNSDSNHLAPGSPTPGSRSPAGLGRPAHPPLRYLSPWHRATRQLASHLHALAAAVDVPPNEAHLISYLGSYAPVPIGTLVGVFGLNKSTLTGMLDRLETAGLATRAINPDDRRSILIDLTDDGRAAAARVRGQLEALEAALDAELGPGPDGEPDGEPRPDDRAAFARIIAAIGRVTGALPATGPGAAPATSPGAPPVAQPRSPNDDSEINPHPGERD